MDFIAVDVETANSQRWSICQLGICVVEAGKVVKTDSVLIDPECEFDPFNVEIHGIDAKDVKGKGNFRSSFLPASGNYKIRGGKREWRGRHAMASAVAISIRSGWPDQHCSSPH